MSNDQSTAPRSLRMLGVPIHDITLFETIAWANQVIQRGTPRQIATVNVEFLMAAQRQPTFKALLNRTALNVPDSIGIMLNARILGDRLRERVPGVELVKALCGLAARRGYRPFLLGAAPGVAEKAAAALVAENRGLRIAGVYAGSPDPAEEDQIVDWVRAAEPDMLFVAYGAPKQDQWIARNMNRLSVPICVGVGGTLDYVAGIVPRAPQAMRQLGLEWLHRLITQPWRWRRMLALPLNLWLIWQERRSLHAKPASR